LSCYSKKIELVGLRKCPYYHDDVTIINISQSLLHNMAKKQPGIMIKRNHVTVTL